ncbi:MAG: DeoR/GlpR transcriptional regulator [Spirochaetaceae bacterium]|nr:MAG: DeoR/GlpR transcriptional regulator [Spirochaetaceae bacterium]
MMLAEQRLQEIMSRLRSLGTLTVEAVAREFEVSLDTVRRDFNRLARQPGVRRAHGGILLDRTERDSPLSEREQRFSREKLAVARAAAGLVEPGETIVLDAGSTTALMVDYITAPEVTVITCSVAIAARAFVRDNLTVFVMGGLVHSTTGSTVGDDALRMIRSMQASTAFLGANGFGLERGLVTPNYHEAGNKRAIMEVSRRRVLLVDSSKLGRHALARFGELAEMDVIVTDGGIPEHELDALRRQVDRVIAVDVEGTGMNGEMAL